MGYSGQYQSKVTHLPRPLVSTFYPSPTIFSDLKGFGLFTFINQKPRPRGLWEFVIFVQENRGMKIAGLFCCIWLFSACMPAEEDGYVYSEPGKTPPLYNLTTRFDREKMAQKALARADLIYRAGQPFTSDSLLQQALRYYRTSKPLPEISRVYFYLGVYYEREQRLEEALAACTLSERRLLAVDSSFVRDSVSRKIVALRQKIGEGRAENLQWKYRYQELRRESRNLERQLSIWRWLCIGLGLLLFTLAGVSRYRSVRRKRELFKSQLFIEQLQRAADELKEKSLRELDEKDEKLKDFFRLRVEMIKEFVGLSRKYANNLEKLKDKFSAMVSTDSFSPEDWALLQEGVNITGHGIIDYLRLTYPDLTEENLRYCALICAGFETDELAVLWGVNNDSIYKRRTRLRQKLGLEKTQDLKKFFDELIRRLA